MTRRSAGRIEVARALWYTKPGAVEIRNAALGPLQPGQVTIRSLFSGVSRGTERLVLSGLVPVAEHDRMRAPMQEGSFPFPVKYGYCAVGTIEAGPKPLIGRQVFCLHPHQTLFQAPLDRVTLLPEGFPPRRATLAANMETALNALWDSGAGPADRIVVVGAGIVGLLVAYLAARLPGAEVTVIDPVEARRALVESFGCSFAGPSQFPSPLAGEVARQAGGLPSARGAGGGKATAKTVETAPPPPLRGTSPARREEKQAADIVFHTSASEAGLATAIASAGFEATIVELSWYGDKKVAVPLGGPFHSQRLKLISSQVGHVSAGRRPRWDYPRRMQSALALLADDRLDVLLTAEIAFDDAPAKLPGLLAADAPGLAPVIRYE